MGDGEWVVVVGRGGGKGEEEKKEQNVVCRKCVTQWKDDLKSLSTQKKTKKKI